jgi:hypothetical protein
MRVQCAHLKESEQRERFMSTSREAHLGQGLAALVSLLSIGFRENLIKLRG